MPDKTTANVLEIRNVSREVSKNGSKFKTVDSVSFKFNQCRNYNIIGPSGAGKSSLLRLLNRLDEVTEGEILFQNKPIADYPPTELRKKISFMFQEPFLFPGTVTSNLKFCDSGCTDDDIRLFLERVGLNAGFADTDVSELSVGERQRIALTRALMSNPEILLLDEPTAALDPSSSETIERLLLSLIEERCLTTIVVTHNPDQARRLGGETLLLVSGRLVESDESEKLLTSPKTELAQKYLRRELK